MSDHIIGSRFQPIVLLATQNIVGHEILTQLNSTTRLEYWFIQLTPQMACDYFITQSRLERTVESAESLRLINLPVAVLTHYALVQKIIHHANHFRTGIELQDPDELARLTADEMCQLRTNLSNLKQAGFTLWLDDFKPQYLSTLTALNHTFDGVKIDRSILHECRDRLPTLRHTVQEAKPIAAIVLLEGIETRRDVKLAQASGALLGQGFYWPEKQVAFPRRLQ
ncbi:EAL domain-containing protein [Entomohabitans teleogrylli]|uniref:EAL domain-containing protein n=1 Tax=Entomohabitans teleogrylli TaxID=1384589 RepID=UPI00073D69B5|nr:EAL domain-containing protein [Entomohabitans teleogrylli]